MKISIIYFSATGNTAQAAKMIAAGMESVENTEVKFFNLPDEENWDKEFIRESKAVVFGTPTYYANICWQMKQWLDTRGVTYQLGGKLGSAFATENNPNGGGAELAIMTMYSHLLVYGMLVYSSGVEYGRPPIHIGPTIVSSRIQEHEACCVRFGKHIAIKAHELFDR